jgi:molecular chaperone GrpE (heat shock protein)
LASPESDPISREVERLRAALEQQNETSRRSFDALYEELRQYKEDFIFQSEKPLLLDLLLFYDSLNWFQQSIIKGEMSPEVIADSFQYLIDEFIELLYRRDVLPMETRKRFDRENQKAIQVVPTDDPKLDYAVKRVLKRGFSRADRKLRAEEVIIHRHTPATSDDKR